MPLSVTEVPMATERGRQAYLAGARPDNCPYAPGTVAQVLWLQAWFLEDEDFNESTVALVHQRGRGQ